MAITVAPALMSQPVVTTVVGPDGILSARLDEANAGILLRADYGGTPEEIQRTVRFWRGDGTLVRSGDPAWVGGTIAHAYDHEAPIGEPAVYYVTAVDDDLTQIGDPSAKVAVQLPDPKTVRDVWIKSVGSPDLSMRVWVENPPEVSRAARSTFTDVHGSRNPLSKWDVRSGQTMSFTVVTDSKAEAAALDALLDSGPLLVQTRSDYDLPGFYCLPGDVTRTRVARMGEPTSRWDVPLTEVRRPATLDSPLRIPGLSWATMPDLYATWDELSSRVASWDELIWGAA